MLSACSDGLDPNYRKATLDILTELIATHIQEGKLRDKGL
jgi:hypothetical protein